MDNLTSSQNLYTIFGYLFPGFLLVTLFVIDVDLNSFLNNKNEELKIESILNFFSQGTMSDFKIIPFFIFMFFCYLMGHIISAISSIIIERIIVKNMLGYPSENLLKECNKKEYLDFKKPFSKSFIKKLKQKIESKFNVKDENEYYWLCYTSILNEKPHLTNRIQHFVNLYGFSRNITAAFFIYVFLRISILTWCINIDFDKYTLLINFIFVFCGILMFWNYLKLFKRQAVDIYITFLTSVDKE